MEPLASECARNLSAIRIGEFLPLLIHRRGVIGAEHRGGLRSQAWRLARNLNVERYLVAVEPQLEQLAYAAEWRFFEALDGQCCSALAAQIVVAAQLPQLGQRLAYRVWACAGKLHGQSVRG